MQKNAFIGIAAAVVIGGVALAVFWPQRQGVTVYCAVDDNHANPVLDAFEQETGIDVIRVFDAEASKTVGLVRRLVEEKDKPACDVFWNNEILHTIRLGRMGLLEPYDSPAAADIPATFRDSGHLWTGFAARARILIVSDDLMPDVAARPTSMYDLVDEKYKSQQGFVRPLTGTTLTHASVLYTVLGAEGARTWFDGLFKMDCIFPSGNGPMARMVGDGQRAFGFTDTDDFRKQQLSGQKVSIVYPDQGDGGIGTLFIPNTVSMIKGGPRPDLAQKLIDFLLSERVEQMMAEGDSANIPVRASVARPDYVKGPPEIRAMEVDWDDVVVNAEARLEELQALWQD